MRCEGVDWNREGPWFDPERPGWGSGISLMVAGHRVRDARVSPIAPIPARACPRHRHRLCSWGPRIHPGPPTARPTGERIRGANGLATAAGQGATTGCHCAAAPRRGCSGGCVEASPARRASTSRSCGSASYCSPSAAGSASSSTPWPGSSSPWRTSPRTSSRAPFRTGGASGSSSPSSPPSCWSRSSPPA